MSIVLAMVIPTRNRAALAVQAIQSLLAQPVAAVRVFVSDNSTERAEIELLSSFCASCTDERLVYRQAPESMPMGAHWNWAIQEALRTFDATHVTVHYDRKLARPGDVALLTQLAASHPCTVVTFAPYAAAAPAGGRYYVAQTRTDGRLYEIDVRRFLATVAAGKLQRLPLAMPLLNNCIVPREVVAAVRARFGGICDSLAADVSFTFRFFGMYDRYLYASRAVGVYQGLARSHAYGFITGKETDLADLRAAVGETSWLDAAPIPGLTLGQNMLFHEYVLAQRVFGIERFPPIDPKGYLAELSSALPDVADPAIRSELGATLERHGWRRPIAGGLTLSRIKASIRYRGGRLLRRMAQATRIGPPSEATFATEAEAVRAALAMPPREVRRCSIMHQLHAVVVE